MAQSKKELKYRIKSVKNTKKMTRAMEMTAAARMRKAQLATLSSRPYAQTASHILSDISSQEEYQQHPLLQTRPIQNICAIVITTDKGLCGGLNAQLIKTAESFYKQKTAEGKSVSFITVGKKGVHGLRAYPTTFSKTNLSLPVKKDELTEINLHSIEAFIKQSFDAVVVIYPKFVNTFTQQPDTMYLLPFTPQKGAISQDFTYEPTVEEILDQLIPRFIQVQLYQTFLEANASEQSARMVAMKNATDSASDIIDALTLKYNQVRQSLITQEIIEIMSAKFALE